MRKASDPAKSGKPRAPADAETIRTVATNRRARYEYDVLDTYEAGIVLVGTEVKALRDGHCSIAEAYAVLQRGELFLKNAEIQEYRHGNRMNHAPKQTRKLLLHRDELKKIAGRVRERGLTVVPLRLYFKQGFAKVELAVVRGRKLHDKRASKAEAEAKREIARVERGRGRGRGRYD